jgi:hypothetical protein
MWGCIINGVQAAGLEHKGIRAGPWDGATVGFLIAYTAGTIQLSFSLMVPRLNHNSQLCLYCTRLPQ